jgi:membrane associated rhomboid family serine protease
MVNTVMEDIKMRFSSGDMVTRLLIVNIAVFLFLRISGVIFFLIGQETWTQTLVNYVSIPMQGQQLLLRPWTWLTHLFAHFELGHLFWNMLYLYWFGQIMKDLIGNHRVLPFYILTGLGGMVVEIIFYQFSGSVTPTYALGASAAVMGIVVGTATVSPHYEIHLLFIGGVKLMYVAFVAVLLDVIALPNMNASGVAHFAHLGGAFMGFLVAKQMQNGNDWTTGFNHYLKTLTNWFSNFNKKKKPSVIYKNPNLMQRPKASSDTVAMNKKERQIKVDAILDKIKKGGYESLTAEEKAFLFSASKEE